MRNMGFADAVPMPPGQVQGVDVVSVAALAQVKLQARPIGRPDIQDLREAALGRRTVVFAVEGYTLDALAFASAGGMALFRFERQGEPQPVNDHAVALMAGPGSTPVVATGPRALCYSLRCDDQRAVQLINGQRKGFLRKEKLLGVRQSWVTLAQVAVAYTSTSWRRTLRQSRRMVAFETLSGNPFLPPQLSPELVHQAPYGIQPIPPLYEARAFVEHMYAVWNRYWQSRHAAARQREAGALGARGVPVKEARSLHLSPCEPLLLPVFVGLLAYGSGERLVVVEGAGGSVSQQLSLEFTHHLGYLRWQLSGARAIPTG
jgi:hypothetical protein